MSKRDVEEVFGAQWIQDALAFERDRAEHELWLLAEQVMTANQYQAFRLRFHDGLSQRTIAKALGVSRQAVRDRIVNGTERLRQATNDGPPTWKERP